MPDDFEHGLDALTADRPEQARDKFELAAAQNPDNIRFAAYCAWAQYLVIANRVRSGGEADLTERESASQTYRGVIQAAIDGDRTFDMGFVSLGRILADDGDLEGAKAAFLSALRINPNNRDANNYLTELEGPSARPPNVV